MAFVPGELMLPHLVIAGRTSPTPFLSRRRRPATSTKSRASAMFAKPSYDAFLSTRSFNRQRAIALIRSASEMSQHSAICFVGTHAMMIGLKIGRAPGRRSHGRPRRRQSSD